MFDCCQEKEGLFTELREVVHRFEQTLWNNDDAATGSDNHDDDDENIEPSVILLLPGSVCEWSRRLNYTRLRRCVKKRETLLPPPSSYHHE